MCLPKDFDVFSKSQTTFISKSARHVVLLKDVRAINTTASGPAQYTEESLYKIIMLL